MINSTGKLLRKPFKMEEALLIYFFPETASLLWLDRKIIFKGSSRHSLHWPECTSAQTGRASISDPDEKA